MPTVAEANPSHCRPLPAVACHYQPLPAIGKGGRAHPHEASQLANKPAKRWQKTSTKVGNIYVFNSYISCTFQYVAYYVLRIETAKSWTFFKVPIIMKAPGTFAADLQDAAARSRSAAMVRGRPPSPMFGHGRPCLAAAGHGAH